MDHSYSFVPQDFLNPYYALSKCQWLRGGGNEIQLLAPEGEDPEAESTHLQRSKCNEMSAAFQK